jgi:hypothetical protein
MTGSQAECCAKVRKLAHKIAGGGGSRRSAKARQDIDLADLRWRLTCLWSGEYSLGSDFLGVARARGELVRLIEIPVPKEENNGIFDRLSAAQVSRTRLVREAEAAVGENFGYAIRGFLNRLVASPEAHTRRAVELMERFLERVGAASDPWTRRFAIKFAIVYAAARLAAELEVAPWSPGHPFKGIQRLYRRARALVITPEEAFTGLLHQLANNASSTSRLASALPWNKGLDPWRSGSIERQSMMMDALSSSFKASLPDLMMPRGKVAVAVRPSRCRN